jgi:hypothetical protein
MRRSHTHIQMVDECLTALSAAPDRSALFDCLIPVRCSHANWLDPTRTARLTLRRILTV